MFRYKILLGVFAAAFALLTFFAKTTLAQAVSVDSTTRTVENSSIKIRWDLTNAERIREFYYKPFSPTWNLSGAQDNEFFGNAASFFPTQYIQDVSLVGSSNSNSTWEHSINGETARIEIHSDNQNGIPVDTVYEFTAGSPSFKVTRTFGFNNWSLPPSRLVPYLVRTYHRDDFTRYAWEKTDGTVGVSDETCEYSCSPGGWKQTWIDLEAPALNVGIGIVNLSGNPSSELWLDKDSNSNTAVISASIPNYGYSQSLTVSYLIVPHLSDYGSLRLPFLDLPWDYEGQGLSFGDAATAITSYFDHQYPFFDVLKALPEPSYAIGTLINYEGNEWISGTGKGRSGHDGYDWLRSAGVHNGDLVLAAADGIALYVNAGKDSAACGSPSCGNAILINHPNYFQTRYYHLQDGDTVAQKFTTPQPVKKGDPIGRVGSTGVSDAPHIHFMVIQDKDRDGDYNDDRPGGVTDPFGWQSFEEDPWANKEEFDYRGQKMTGNVSYYLWTKLIPNLSCSFPSNQGICQLERYRLENEGGLEEGDVAEMTYYSPSVQTFDDLRSIGSTLRIIVRDALGNIRSTLNGFFRLIIDFSSLDLTGLNLNTISIYSSPDGVNWNREETSVDLANHTASATVNHLSYFVLMAERVDTVAPVAETLLIGEEGEQGFYRSDVQVVINSQDNEGGLGVYYVGYNVDNEYFREYTSPFNISDEGEHVVEFYSVDNDGNIEEIKSTSFTIDKTVPEARIYYEQTLKKIVFEGVDDNETLVSEEASGKSIVIEDTAGNKITLLSRIIRTNQLKVLTISSIKYSDGLRTVPGANKLLIYDNLKQYPEIFRLLLQSWFERGEERVQIVYRPKTNKSIILIKEFGLPVQKEQRDGLVILQIETEKGNLNHNY